ncbi:hypothetical protein TRAPUB_5222 [Trametes pubescens]|uniref:AN1-type domain-containing protein n=1 Tax=Trametes pubescens TaxID=154538 RepID=A0A1M2V8U9_TRAPU|nr:hypothetical protein TRAPUB_5222 [Trametes pubescens]
MADSDSGLVHIGASCALPTCNMNDFLPIRCKCDQLFCRDHIQPDLHTCPLLAQDAQRGASEPSESTLEKNAAAKSLLSKHFGPSSAATTSGPSRPAASTNPKKLAQQRQLAVMKMRHKAKPADPKDTAVSVPVGERLHLKVRKAEEDPAAERILWFKKEGR